MTSMYLFSWSVACIEKYMPRYTFTEQRFVKHWNYILESERNSQYDFCLVMLTFWAITSWYCDTSDKNYTATLG